MKSDKKVCIIIPFFGEWPAYFNFFLSGCKHNDWLDILFFTDNKLPLGAPDNVKLYSFSINNFNELCRRQIGIDIHLQYPYKICDFRPFFGVIFCEYLSDYTYWGYGDIDVIYGNLSRFLLQKLDELPTKRLSRMP